jgi:hypothetical protein
MPAHPLWTGDDRGLKVGGPEYFVLEMKWNSIGKYEKSRSAIEGFNESLQKRARRAGRQSISKLSEKLRSEAPLIEDFNPDRSKVESFEN